MLIRTHSYIITDYERSNFSVSQARFEDGLPSELVTIPSTSPPPASPVSHNNAENPSQKQGRHMIIIGSSIGAAFFLLCTVLAIVYCLHRRYAKLRNQGGTQEPPPLPPDRGPSGLTACSVREIGNNSIIGLVRELPETGRVALLDIQSPLGSGNEMPEMVGTVPVTVHELRTHRSSQEKLMIKGDRTRTRKLFNPPQVSGHSCIGIYSANGPRLIKPTTSTSARQSILRKSIDFDVLRAEIYAAYLRKPLDLNRSLPPTPISDSPMVSPTGPTFKKDPSLRQRSRRAHSASQSPVLSIIRPHTQISKHSVTARHRGQISPGLTLAVAERSSPSGQPGSVFQAVSPLSM